MIVKNSLYPNNLGFSAITDMKTRFESLQLQLATGKIASTLSELGTSRSYDLQLHATRARVEGYQNSIQMVDLRLNFLSNTISRIDELEAETRSSASPGGYGTDNTNTTLGPSLANSRLEELVALLNTDVDGRFLFGGDATDRKPVASAGEILNGAGGRDGFRTILSQRLAADQGVDGLGRLALASAAETTTLSEDGVHPFGFKLSTLSTDSSDVTLTAPSGSPASLSVEFTGPAAEGDVIRIGLTLPDGQELNLALKAVTGTPQNENEFQIGATAADSSANFAAVLDAALLAAGERELASASAYAAADNFFNSTGDAVMRVDGPPYDSATGLVAATDTDTVLWYQGNDAANPRSSVSARVDDAVRANYGVQANEAGIAELMRNLAVMASASFATGDDTAHDRFDYIATQQQSRLAESNNAQSGSIEVIALELGLAKTTVGQAGERHSAHLNQLETMIADIEAASMEEVAVELNALQTRLTASYETMSMLSQLTLVNFIR